MYRKIYENYKENSEDLEVEIKSVIRIDRDNLRDEMLEFTEHFLKWSTFLTFAEDEARRAKALLSDVVYPKARLNAETIIVKSGRKPTDKEKDAQARLDPEYVTAQAEYFNAQSLLDGFKHIVEALRLKKDLMQSVNSRQRVEASYYSSEGALREE